MAKPMAKIKNNKVINIEWCSFYQQETENLKDPGERIITIGDTYMSGRWFRKGQEILTPYEQLQKENEQLQQQNSDMLQALEILGVEEE